MSLREKLIAALTALPAFLPAGLAHAAEPPFCQLPAFKLLEQKLTGTKPGNLHVFKIGQLALVGSAVGDSKVADEKALVAKLSRASVQERYCTWYVNDGNREARSTFNWHNLPKPTGSDYAGMAARYMDEIGDQFDRSSVSFLSCAEQFGIVSVGCDGMKHRGPTVFAMILGYAGCTPEHAMTIANYYWSENGIKPQMRVELARAAANLAAEHPAESARFRALTGVR